MKKKAEKKQKGRPSSFKKKYTQMLLEYFDVEPYVTKTKLITYRDGNTAEVQYDDPSDFPTLAEFATKIGVHRETLLNWAKKDSDFFDAYKKAKDYQEKYIAINGMRGTVNTTFAIFAAKNILGWKDRQDITSGDDKITGEIVKVELPKNGRDG